MEGIAPPPPGGGGVEWPGGWVGGWLSPGQGPNPPPPRESFLINGLTTVNHILNHSGGNPLSLDYMQQIAAAMVQDGADAIFSYGLQFIQKLQEKNI